MSSEIRLTSANFVLACVAAFLYSGSLFSLMPILPQYIDMLGGTAGQIGLTLGIFNLTGMLTRPQLGRWADRYGRKRLMIIGCGIFVVLMPLYGMIHSVFMLCILRIGHGFAHACFHAASGSYIAALVPQARRGEFIGIYGTANVVALAIFPALGTLFIQKYQDFSSVFVWLAVLGAAALGALLFIRDIPVPGTSATKLFAVGLRRTVLIPSLTILTGSTGYGAVVTFIPIFAPQRGVLDVGAFFTAVAVSTIASRLVAGRLSDKIGRSRILPPVMLCLATALFVLPSLNSLGLLVLIGLIQGFGVGAFTPALTALVVDKTLPADRGSALGFLTSFFDLGITAGAALLGLVADRFGYSVMFSIAGIIVIAGMMLFLLCAERDNAGTLGAQEKIAP